MKIRANLPTDVANYLPRITTLPNSSVWSPIQYLAKGIFPAFIIEDLRSMRITSNLGAICSGLLKNAINAFREFIWKPRCTKNVDREKRLEITKAEKRFRSPSRTN